MVLKRLNGVWMFTWGKIMKRNMVNCFGLISWPLMQWPRDRISIFLS